MNEFIDEYCERIAPGFLGEPLNAISNLGFIVVAILLAKQYSAAKNQTTLPVQWDVAILILLTFLVGIGSGLWHLLAVSWTLSADIIPILLFINLYILSCFARVLQCSWKQTLLWFVIYHVFNTSLRHIFPTDFLNGSIFYLPTLIFLLGIAYIVWKRKLQEKVFYLIAAILFTVSLAFRTIDESVCSVIPYGTHFVWHLINAVMMYYLMQGLMFRLKLKWAGL